VNLNIDEQEGKNKLTVKVVEKSSLQLRLGGKVDTDRQTQLYLELGEDNFSGTGIKTRLLNRIGTKDGYHGLHIRDDRVFTTYLTFSLQGSYSWEINPFTRNEQYLGDYEEKRTGVVFQVGQQMRSLGQVIAELRLEHVKDYPIKGEFELAQDIELRSLAIRSITDKRDRIDFPTKGIYNHWAWENGSKFLLNSQESFTKAMINLEGFFTFSNYHTWRVRLFAGIGDKTLPFSENFRMGGFNDFYGLHEKEIFGRQLFITSLEYRIKLPLNIHSNLLINDIYLSTRYDFGGIWPNPELVFKSDDFFSGIGAALGVDTFFGPLYFAVGRTTRGNSAGYISWGFNF
jgi:outer membrane protein assembly factor BamA